MRTTSLFQFIPKLALCFFFTFANDPYQRSSLSPYIYRYILLACNIKLTARLTLSSYGLIVAIRKIVVISLWSRVGLDKYIAQSNESTLPIDFFPFLVIYATLFFIHQCD